MRRKIIFGLVLLVIWGAIYFVFPRDLFNNMFRQEGKLRSKPSVYKLKNVDKIKFEMTKDEVLGLLGEPLKKETRNGLEIFYFGTKITDFYYSSPQARERYYKKTGFRAPSPQIETSVFIFKGNKLMFWKKEFSRNLGL